MALSINAKLKAHSRPKIITTLMKYTTHSIVSQLAVLQAEEKHARNSVPKCPCKLLQPADQPIAGSGSLEGHFGTGLRARFSSAWSTVDCDYYELWGAENFFNNRKLQKT